MHTMQIILNIRSGIEPTHLSSPMSGHQTTFHRLHMYINVHDIIRPSLYLAMYDPIKQVFRKTSRKTFRILHSSTIRKRRHKRQDPGPSPRPSPSCVNAPSVGLVIHFVVPH